MPAEELTHEVEHGVRFWGLEQDGRLLGVMGLQDVEDVTLIRHAYVRTTQRRRGIGGRLLQDLRAKATRPLLVGTWAAARWAIEFYRQHGFEPVPRDGAAPAAPLLVGARAPDRDVRGAGGARLARSGGLAFRCTRMKPHPEMQATSPRLLQCAGALTRVVSGMNDDSGDVRSVMTEVDPHHEAPARGPADLGESGGGEDAAAADVELAPGDLLPGSVSIG